MPFEEVPKVRQAGELTQRGFCPIVGGWPMPRLPWPAPALPSLRSAQREVDGLGTVNAQGVTWFYLITSNPYYVETEGQRLDVFSFLFYFLTQ